MKKRAFGILGGPMTWVTALSLFAALTIPLNVAAQNNAAQIPKPTHHHYKLVDVGTFGGPSSTNGFGGIGAKTMNSGGAVTGLADTSAPDPYCLVDCFLNHAFQWQNGVLTDLGTLPGAANDSFAFGINSLGWIAGESTTGAIDPLTGNLEEDAVIWKNGQIIDLGTLGGTASVANAVNNRGQVVGVALNTNLDPFSAGFPAPSCDGNLCIAESYSVLLFQPLTQMHAVL